MSHRRWLGIGFLMGAIRKAKEATEAENSFDAIEKGTFSGFLGDISHRLLKPDIKKIMKKKKEPKKDSLIDGW